MSDDLKKRLRDTPNWMREGFQDWKDNVRTYDSAPFEAADRIEELEAEAARLRGAVAEAVYLLDPEAEDILKGAGIYRIVRAYHQAGGALSNDLKDALHEMKEDSDE